MKTKKNLINDVKKYNSQYNLTQARGHIFQFTFIGSPCSVSCLSENVLKYYFPHYVTLLPKACI